MITPMCPICLPPRYFYNKQDLNKHMNAVKKGKERHREEFKVLIPESFKKRIQK